MLISPLIAAVSLVVCGFVFCLVVLIICCIRRRGVRGCEESLNCSADPDIELSNSQELEHSVHSIIRASQSVNNVNKESKSVHDITEVSQYGSSIHSVNYFSQWMTSWHRSGDSTKNIIRNVFALEPSATLGQEWNDSHKSESSPEYVAVPARMMSTLPKEDLKLGSFTGDCTNQFKHIYKASKLKPKRPTEQESLRFLSTGILSQKSTGEYKPLTQYLSPVCCSEGAVSPVHSEAASNRRAGSIRSGDISALTSPTVTECSFEKNPLHLDRINETKNDIFTIHENSYDSLDPLPTETEVKVAPHVHIYKIGSIYNFQINTNPSLYSVLQQSKQEELDKILSNTSPGPHSYTYSGPRNAQSFSPTMFSV